MADYLSRQDATAAIETIAKVVDAARFLAGHPGSGEIVSEAGHRRWRVGRTPYILLYRQGDGVIDITRVVHAARDWRMFV